MVEEGGVQGPVERLMAGVEFQWLLQFYTGG